MAESVGSMSLKRVREELCKIASKQGRSPEHRLFLESQEKLALEQIENSYMEQCDPRELKFRKTGFDPLMYDRLRLYNSDPWHDEDRVCPACLKDIDDLEIKPSRCMCY